ncbi:unnamed protein product [Diamesa serratosioi]
MCHGEKLNCQFQVAEFNSWIYSCVVSSLVNTNNNTVIDGYSGVHEDGRPDNDVKGIWIEDTNTKYIPSGLGLLFSLNSLVMWNTELVEIKSQDFIGMQNLEELSLALNELKSVPIDVFSTLTKLRTIELHNNQLEEIPNGVFANNLELNSIELSHNYIGILGSTLFSGLTKLYTVDLSGNNCINENYTGKKQISKLK